VSFGIFLFGKKGTLHVSVLGYSESTEAIAVIAISLLMGRKPARRHTACALK
jgi:hypothetical protein